MSLRINFPAYNLETKLSLSWDCEDSLVIFIDSLACSLLSRLQVGKDNNSKADFIYKIPALS